MGTIPVSPEIINVLPSVLSAGGGSIDLNNILLTTSYRVPIGTAATFSDKTAVGTYFGLSSSQYAYAERYFAGYDNATKFPGALLITQYNPASVAAWLQGGNVSALSLLQLQGLSGTFSVVVDGLTWATAGVSLAAATSPSNAATLITTAITVTLPQAAEITGSIAEATASFTASIAGNVMYVTDVASGIIVPGSILAGTDVTTNTVVDNQLSGTTGGVGSYAVNINQITASTTITSEYSVLTETAVASGAIAVGQTLSGSGISANTVVTGVGPIVATHPTYYVSVYQTAGSTDILAKGTPPIVSYDSVSGAFWVTSGVRGVASTMAYATGTLATSLDMTSTTAVALSRGADPATPATFMTSLTGITQNWATFVTEFDPDGGPGTITQKLAFSQWVSLQGNRWIYLGWDTDPNPAATYPATNSFGYQVTQVLNYSGTAPLWEPSNQYLEAFVAGMTASINFDVKGGRITPAFKHLSGLVAGVTQSSVATNLAGNPQTEDSWGNGYNFYGAYSTAKKNYIWYQRGTISGPFTWYDTYANQIWLNQRFITSIADYLNTVNSIPYTTAGYATVEQVLADDIKAALNCGVIVKGVTLSSSQTLAVNTAAGKDIASTIQQQGWYLLATPATAAQRQARTSPPFKFMYCDGGSIQAINMGSVVLQ
jgi:hypothetical protein